MHAYRLNICASLKDTGLLKYPIHLRNHYFASNPQNSNHKVSYRSTVLKSQQSFDTKKKKQKRQKSMSLYGRIASELCRFISFELRKLPAPIRKKKNTKTAALQSGNIS